jgi:hypothetical protein
MSTVTSTRPKLDIQSNGKTSKPEKCVITPPNIQTIECRIIGTAPLVIHKFSHKAKQGMIEVVENGKN